MKSLFYCILFAFSCFISSNLNAQDINFGINHDMPLLKSCDDSVRINLNVAGTIFGYNPQKHFFIDLTITWGDGKSNQMNLPINGSSTSFAVTLKHDYANNGPVNISARAVLSNEPPQNGTTASQQLKMGKPSDCIPFGIYLYDDVMANCLSDSNDLEIPKFPVPFKIDNAPFTINNFFSGKLPKESPHTFQSLPFTVNQGNNTTTYTPKCTTTKPLGNGGQIEFAYSRTFIPGDSAVLASAVVHSHDTVCGTPRPGSFIFRISNSYQDNAIVQVKMNFGDGSDTSFITSADSISSMYLAHIYSIAGTFNSSVEVAFSDTTLYFNPKIIVSGDCGSISGKVYLDKNNNCTYNSGEKTMVNKIVKCTGGNKTYYAFTDSLGNYSFTVDNSTSYFVTVLINDSTSYKSCNNAYSLSTFPATNKNFGIQCPGNEYDFSVNQNTSVFRPGRDAYIWVSFNNNSCNVLTDGTITTTLSDKVDYVSATPAPYLVIGNELRWNVVNLSPEQKFQIQVIVKTKTTATINDTVCNTSNISTALNEENINNNSITTCEQVRTSYDPNDKTAFVNGHISPIGDMTKSDELVYRIRFQNTGNDTAFNIFLLDTIDQNLDMSTLNILSFSHPMKVSTNDNRLIRFEFSDILLPDDKTNEPASQGFVVYKIKPLANTAPGKIIKNTAHIYFDYNEAIVTNTTSNKIVIVSSISELTKTNINIYPNPTNEKLNIDSPSKITSISVIDIVGKTVLRLNDENGLNEINVGDLIEGVYFLRVKQGETTSTKKFVVAK